MIAPISLVNIHLLYGPQIKETEKNFFLMMKVHPWEDLLSFIYNVQQY